jgi:hypothetical protein
MYLGYDVAILVLSIYSKEMKAYENKTRAVHECS